MWQIYYTKKTADMVFQKQGWFYIQMSIYWPIVQVPWLKIHENIHIDGIEFTKFILKIHEFSETLDMWWNTSQINLK